MSEREGHLGTLWSEVWRLHNRFNESSLQLDLESFRVYWESIVEGRIWSRKVIKWSLHSHTVRESNFSGQVECSGFPSKTRFPSRTRLKVVYLRASIETVTYYKYGLYYSLDIDPNKLLLPQNMMHLTMQLRPGYYIMGIFLVIHKPGLRPCLYNRILPRWTVHLVWFVVTCLHNSWAVDVLMSHSKLDGPIHSYCHIL